MSNPASTTEAQRSDVSSRKDHRFLAQLFLEIERRFDTNALKLEGVHLWPLIRLQLGRSFKEADPINDAGQLPGMTPPELFDQKNPDVPLPRNKAERSKLLKAHAKQARLDPVGSKRKVERDFRTLEQAANPAFVIQTKIEKYYLKKADGFFAPILDPVAEDLSHFGTIQRLAIEPLPIECVHEPLRINPNAYLASRTWSKLAVPDRLDKAIEEIESFARAAWPEYPIDRTAVYRRFDRLRQRRDFYYEVYRRLRPEIIFVSSFTGWQHALWAAKDLGIPVVDVQHGGQGPIHFPSTHYSTLPENGCHFLPDVYWLWGDTNLKFSEQWYPGGAKHRHFPVVGGHRGVARWDSDRKTNRLNPADQAFIARHGSRKNVLVTLSYAIDPLMPDAFFDAIGRTPDLHWLIRLHPIHRSQAARDQIVGRLEANGARNFTIDETTDVQLQTALYVSMAHLTPFSTSVREAMAFGVPSAICHPAGELLFREEIETGLLDYCADATGICDFVLRQAGEDATGFGFRSDAIEVSEDAIGRVIETARRVRGSAPRLVSDRAAPGPIGQDIPNRWSSRWKTIKRNLASLRPT